MLEFKDMHEGVERRQGREAEQEGFGYDIAFD